MNCKWKDNSYTGKHANAFHDKVIKANIKYIIYEKIIRDF